MKNPKQISARLGMFRSELDLNSASNYLPSGNTFQLAIVQVILPITDTENAVISRVGIQTASGYRPIGHLVGLRYLAETSSEFPSIFSANLPSVTAWKEFQELYHVELVDSSDTHLVYKVTGLK